MARSFTLVAAIFCSIACLANAFQLAPPSCLAGRRSASPAAIETRPSSSDLRMIFGPPKDDGKPGDYLCKDCGYVFTKGPEAWAKLPDSYGCPPCGAPKFRFKKVPKGSASGKKVEVKKSWF
mmetsp:Transcript_19689/g.42216  ORF Transcript_19689/g.42216 Transcript_19689/m.42216 type:complete len:122 (+) Transcript_19689:136-501(+)